MWNRHLMMTKNIQSVTFVTHGFILNIIIDIFLLIFNILLATIVTLGFAINVLLKHFLLETSTIKIFISSFIGVLKRINPLWENIQ